MIYVDAGTYQLVDNILLTSEDSGVRIQGPSTGVATLDRGNKSSESYVFELANADDLTLSRLRMTGGQFGVYSNSQSGSEGLLIEDSEIFGMTYGIYLLQGNRGTLAGNQVHHNSLGIDVGGGMTVSGNEAYSNGTGITVARMKPAR